MLSVLLSAPAIECNHFSASQHLPGLHRSNFVKGCPRGALPAARDGGLEQPELQLGLLMLLFHASLGAFLPYLPILYKQLDLSKQQIGAMGAVYPVVVLLLGPFWTALADRYHIQKEVLITTFALSALVKLGFLRLPRRNAVATGALVALSAVMSSPTKPLLDAAVMHQLNRKLSYGRARLFGQVGFGMGSYISGIFIANRIKCVVVTHLLFAAPTLLTMQQLLPPRDFDNNIAIQYNNYTDTLYQFAADIERAFSRITTSRRQEMVFFFGIVLIVGILSGIIENFAFSRIIETSTTRNHGQNIGIIPLVASLAGAPVFWMSGRLIGSFGVPLLLGFSLLSYTIRFMLYAQMTAPWQAILPEILRGVTFASFWAATTYYVYDIAPKGHKATMVRIRYDLYFDTKNHSNIVRHCSARCLKWGVHRFGPVRGVAYWWLAL